MRLWTILIAMLLAAMPVAAQEPQEEDPQAEAIDDGTQDPSADPADEVEEAAPTNKPDFAEVVANTRAVWTEPEGSTAGEDEIAASIDYMMGFAVRIIYHEFGHGLVSEFNIPVLGREEDAVDSFAVINMIADDDDPAFAPLARPVDMRDGCLARGCGMLDAQRIDAQIKGQAAGSAWSSLSRLALLMCGQRLNLPAE